MIETDTSDLRNLIETEIPDGRANLETSYTNLERVAAYCEANYIQASNKKAAFEETKRYVVQSLASVAYQINTLASSLLQTLELQTEKIESMRAQVNNIVQIVDIHKEKVARREIGTLTTSKSVQRQHKIVTPAHQERAQRYQRSPINYSVLDHLGHGVKSPNLPNQLLARTGSSVSSISSGFGAMTLHANFPGYEHLLPKGMPAYSSTLSRSHTNREPHYRTPAPIGNQLTTIPKHYSTVGRSQNQGSNYSAVSMGATKLDHPNSMPLPPPQLASVAQYRLSSDSTPLNYVDDQPSPPLPPPPMDTSINDQSVGYTAPNWWPESYIEKAVTLYDYEAQKSDELSFQENSVVFVLRKNDDGWFEGIIDGVAGLFPGNYVQACI